METVKRKPRAHGAIVKGHTIPYGTLVGASYELHKAYYYHGYKEDWMMPELPCVEIDAEYVDPEEELHKKDVVRVVAEMVDGLTPREAKILRMRFGIELMQDYSLEEIGTRFDVTRERIRQIESKALRKMKHPSRIGVFNDLLGRRLVSEKRAGKELEAQAAQVRWAQERNAAQQRDEARKQFKVDQRLREKQREQELEEMYKEDLRLREKWDEIEPMVSDTEWIKHLKETQPDMYQELRNVVTYIWGYNADKVWEMYAEKK